MPTALRAVTELQTLPAELHVEPAVEAALDQTPLAAELHVEPAAIRSALD